MPSGQRLFEPDVTAMRQFARTPSFGRMQRTRMFGRMQRTRIARRTLQAVLYFHWRVAPITALGYGSLPREPL